MLGIILTPVRMEKFSALRHIVKERCSRQWCKNQELYSVYSKICCKISSPADSLDIVGVRPQDAQSVGMDTVFSDCPDAGNDILPALFFIILFKCPGIDGFKANVQSIAARVSHEAEKFRVPGNIWPHLGRPSRLNPLCNHSPEDFLSPPVVGCKVIVNNELGRL